MPVRDAESSGSPRPGPRSALGDVLDQHAELRDLLAQIREAGDSGILGARLERLHHLLEAHFAREEEAGLLHAMGATASAESSIGKCLTQEHREILAGLGQLIHQTSDRGQPVAALRGAVAVILERLERHDERETELFAAAVTIDRSSRAVASPIQSKALEVKLRRTAVEVIIPAEPQILLEATADRHRTLE